MREFRGQTDPNTVNFCLSISQKTNKTKQKKNFLAGWKKKEEIGKWDSYCKCTFTVTIRCIIYQQWFCEEDSELFIDDCCPIRARTTVYVTVCATTKCNTLEAPLQSRFVLCNGSTHEQQPYVFLRLCPKSIVLHGNSSWCVHNLKWIHGLLQSSMSISLRL